MRTPENASTIENVEVRFTKESVIESLRNFPNDPSPVIAYLEQKEKLVQAPYVTREDTEKRTFATSLELAEIYRDAGLTENAADAYNDAADFAQANGMEEEYAAILAELAKI
jgi:hypothetical protein